MIEEKSEKNNKKIRGLKEVVIPNDVEFTTMRSLLGALAEAMNLINPDVSHHHEQTAYLAYLICKEMSMPIELQNMVIYAALLHDVGSVVQGRQKSVSEIERDAKAVSIVGAWMLFELDKDEREAEGLNRFPFGVLGDVVANCQLNQEEIKVATEIAEEKGQTNRAAILKIASVIHLADKVSLMIRPYEPILIQQRRIKETVKKLRGTEFAEDAVDSFLRISEMEYVWMDVMHHPNYFLYFTGDIRPLSLIESVKLTRLMSRIIDSKSPFTAMHSAGVSASARKLAELAGMSKRDCMMMEIAGNLHDLGKLAVPNRILEKPGRLTDDEFDIIKEHPYYTYKILMDIIGFDKIAEWAGYHHEKLNGKGYPFHLDKTMLDTGSRVMSVADIFSAITEVRPYRDGMKREQVINVMKENVQFGALDGDLVDLLLDNYEEVDNERDTLSRKEGKHYFADLKKERERTKDE